LASAAIDHESARCESSEIPIGLNGGNALKFTDAKLFRLARLPEGWATVMRTLKQN
jgi:hypothetical protein